MDPKALGYILCLTRILQPSYTSLYQLTSSGILINVNVVQYNLPKHAVFINGTLKEIVVASCIAVSMDYYLFSAKLHTRDISFINNLSNCLFKFNNLIKYLITIMVWVIQLFQMLLG